MEKLTQTKNVSLEHDESSQNQECSEKSPKTPPNRRSDEMGFFTDVFGGPPRRFSMPEIRRARYSFGEVAESVEEMTGRRRRPDDFYDDIFRGGDQSYSSLPSKAELFGSSLSAHFSLPAELSKSLDSATFGSRNQNQFKMEGSIGGFNTLHSPNGLSKFLSQSFRMPYEVRHKVKNHGRLSCDGLMCSVASHKKDNGEISQKGTKDNDGSAHRFHSSIYKWAEKGVPMLMPLVCGNNLRSKPLKRDYRSKSFNGRTRSGSFMSKMFSPVEDEGSLCVDTETDHLKVEHKNKDKRSQALTKGMLNPIGEALYDELDPKSRTDATDTIAFGGARENLKVDEVRSPYEVYTKEKTEKEVPLMIIKDLLKQEGKPLKVFLTDEVEQQENQENKIITPKGTHANKQVEKKLENNGETGNDSTNAEVDKFSFQGGAENSGLSSGRSGVKGKADFIQIFNKETDSKPKSDFGGTKSFRWNAENINQRDICENLNSIKVKETEKLDDADKKEKLHDADTKKSDVSVKLDKSVHKYKVEQYSRSTSQSHRNCRNSVNQKNGFLSVKENSEISVENDDDPFGENFQVKELLIDPEKLKENEEDPEEIKALDAKIRKWSVGKEGNIRSLLSTLQYVLWPESGWTTVPLVDLIEANEVKKAYQKALLRLHPDKLQQKGAAASQKYTAEKVFELLQEAWDHFNTLAPL